MEEKRHHAYFPTANLKHFISSQCMHISFFHQCGNVKYTTNTFQAINIVWTMYV